MPTTEERLANLEANEKNIFHQLDEIKDEQKDQRRLIVAVEQLAAKTDGIAEKVDRIDQRISSVEAEPGRKFNKYKETIITAIITLIVGAIVGGLIAMLIK